MIDLGSTPLIGPWRWDFRRNMIECSSYFCDFHGVTACGREVPNEHFIEAVHQEDREHIFLLLERAAELGVPFISEHRMVRPDRSVVWVRAIGHCELERGVPIRAEGMTLDVTSLHRSKADPVPEPARARLLRVCVEARRVAEEIGDGAVRQIANLLMEEASRAYYRQARFWH